jgi:response regulator NasT
MSDATLRILIVDQSAARAAVIEEGLREAGHENVVVIRNMRNLLRNIVDADPDVIFIDLENPNRDVLEQMFQVSRIVQRPVAMFVDRSDSSMIEQAIEAGVGAYVVDGLKKERVKSIMDTTIMRFNAFNKLRNELDRTRLALEERKLVDRARGALMKEKGLSEEDAYALLRKLAMDQHLRIGEVAKSVLVTLKLLK